MDPNWAEITSALANISMAVLTSIGFFYVYKQIRASAVDHLYSRMHDIHKIFMLKPELRRYFYDTKQLPADGKDDAAEVSILAEMIADFFQQVFLELDHLPPVAAKGWRCYMKDT